MKQYFIKISILFLALLFSACGGASVASTSKNEISIQNKKSLLNQEKNLLSIDFLVKNEYNKDITVELDNLSVDVNPCVVKEVVMTPESITFSNEHTQQYVNALVEFDEACTPTSYNLIGLSNLALDGKNNSVQYSSAEIEIQPSILEESSSSETGSNTESGDYSFYNVPSPITVDTADKLYTFKVQLIDASSRGVSGQELKILAYDITFGEVVNMVVTTDANGFGTFSLKSPKSLDEINGETLTLTVVHGEEFSTISTSVDFKFNASSDTATSSNYQFKNATSISVGHASEEKSITIDLVNGSGIGVSGKEIQITTLPSQFGSISSSTTLTNAAGRATFAYRAPEDFDAIDGQSTSAQLTFTEDGATISQTITITFTKSTDNTETDTTLPTVVIPSSLRNTTLTSNSKSLEIDIKVFKDIAPYTAGTVHVELPDKVLNGIDVGAFASFSVAVNAQGVATFHYTGPSNLKALLDSGDTGSTFKFYHSENSSNESRQEMRVNYSISADTYIPIDYALNVTTQDNDFSMGIPELQKTFSVVLKDTDGNIVSDSDVNITRVHVQTENALIAQIFDTNTKTSVNSLTLRNENNSAFILKSKQLSGIVPLNITIDFVDINGESKTLSTIVNVRVMSGPPSAISISYAGTSQDTTRAKYEETFAISVTDEYGNKVNTQPYISLGAIIGYAVDGQEASSTETNETKRLFYGREDIVSNNADGVIDILDTDADTTNFEDTTPARTDVFKYVNAEGANTDKLVVFGSGKNYEAMGKWDFSRIDNHTLSLQDDYFGTDRNGLYYAVGHNYYQDQCRSDGREWLGSTDSESYQLDSEGTAVISYKYDYHLTGKDALVWVNLNGFQADTGQNTRIGEVVKHTLRGTGLTKVPTAGYSLEKGTSGLGTFDIWHENAPERYRNAHFAWRVKEGSTCGYTVTNTSNNYDARTCSNGESSEGSSYITFLLQAPADTSCSFDIEGLVVANEF